jgi:ABC-2 type transport system permease protein
MQRIRENINTFRTAMFAPTNNDEEAWVDHEAVMTPREARLNRAALWLRGTAVVMLCLAIVPLILLAVTGQLSLVRSLALARTTLPDDLAVIAALVGLMANAGIVLMLAVGALAQEFWTLPLLVLTLIGNLIALIAAGFLPSLITIGLVGFVGVQLFGDWRAFHLNPVAVKELRGRMRGVRAFAIISVFLIMMSSFTLVLYILQLPSVLGARTIITGELGRVLFTGVVGAELMMIVFIVPALTAGAVAGERERKTYDLLQTTLLPAPSFLVGKMESALGYIVLLLLSAIPLQSIAFLFGGISESEVFLAFVVLSMTALILGAMGLYFSAQTDRTITATVRVYSIALAVIFALPLISLIFLQRSFGRAVAGVAVGGASPVFEALSIYVDMILNSLNPVTAAYYTQQMLVNQQQSAVMHVQLQTTGGTIPIIAPWILLVVIYLILTAVLILLAVRRMRGGRVMQDPADVMPVATPQTQS